MESDGLVLPTETPPPELKVDVYNLDGFVCTVVATATVTVWELKSLLKSRLHIPKREMKLMFGSHILSSPDESLGSAFGVMEATFDVTLIRTPAICNYCAAPGMKRCGGCSTYYCRRRCQRRDWSCHRDQCSATRTKQLDEPFA